MDESPPQEKNFFPPTLPYVTFSALSEEEMGRIPSCPPFPHLNPILSATPGWGVFLRETLLCVKIKTCIKGIYRIVAYIE